jgi:hypothetical protein
LEEGSFILCQCHEIKFNFRGFILFDPLLDCCARYCEPWEITSWGAMCFVSVWKIIGSNTDGTWLQSI